MKTREILRASFNLEDEHENKLYNHAIQHKNVSAFLKRLINAHMETSQGGIIVDFHEVIEDGDDDMSSFT